MAQIETIVQEAGPIARPLWRHNFTFFDKRAKAFAMHPTGDTFGTELALEA